MGNPDRRPTESYPEHNIQNVTHHVRLHQQQFVGSVAPVANPFKDNLDDLTDSDDLGELLLSPKQPSLTTSASIQHQSWV